MEKKKRNNLIYRLVTIVTLVLPMPIFLIVSACILSIEPDYVITNVSGSATSIDENFTYELVGEQHRLNIKTDKTYTITGETAFDNGTTYISFVPSQTIFQLDSGFHQIQDLDGTFTFVNHTNELFNKQLAYKLPIGIIFGILAVVIVCLIIFKKMNIMKKRPRASTLIALIFGTLVLLILEMIISSMLGVFLVATSMWAAYCIEYIVYHRKTLFKEKPKTESETLASLSEMLEEYKK